MDIILSRIKWNFVFIILDDVIIRCKSIMETFTQVEAVLRLFQQAGAALKLKMCFFFQPYVEYLGHVFLQGKVVAKATTKAIREARTPNNCT